MTDARAQQGRTPSRGTAALAPRCRQIDARPGVGPCRFRLDHVGGATSCRAIFKAISDPLFSEDPDGTPVGYLVESVEPNADYTEWTLKIRDGIKFHDGTPLDGAAVKFNIESCQYSPLTGSSFVTIDKVTASGQDVVITTKGPWVAPADGIPGLRPVFVHVLSDVARQPRRHPAAHRDDAGVRRRVGRDTGRRRCRPNRSGSARSSTSRTPPATATSSNRSATTITGAGRTASRTRNCRTSTGSTSSSPLTKTAGRTRRGRANSIS